MEVKRVLKMDFTEQVTCGNCGKKLPVEIIDVQSSAMIAIFCKHCKMVTVLEVCNK
jgi:predicted nucleic-acid-binding Zn-ribbon protein